VRQVFSTFVTAAGLMMAGAVTSVEAALEAGHDGASRREGVTRRWCSA
jgi:hypothetical protein